MVPIINGRESLATCRASVASNPAAFLEDQVCRMLKKNFTESMECKTVHLKKSSISEDFCQQLP
jgi:hypothetical protein